MDFAAGEKDLPIVDARIRALWVHWLQARAGRLMPARRAIDPLAIPLTLPHLYIYDFEPVSGRFYCRLAGEEIQLGSGVRGVRHFLDEMFAPEVAATIATRYRRIVDGPAIVCARGLMRSAAGYVMPIERLVLPLSEDGSTVSGLIGATLYRRDEALNSLVDAAPRLAEEQFLPVPPAGWQPLG